MVLKQKKFLKKLNGTGVPPPLLHGKCHFKFPFFGTLPQDPGKCVNMKNVQKKLFLSVGTLFCQKCVHLWARAFGLWNMILRCLKPDFQVQRKIPRVIAKSFVLAVEIENWGSIKRFKFQLIEAGAEWGCPNLRSYIIKVSCQRTFNRF